MNFVEEINKICKCEVKHQYIEYNQYQIKSTNFTLTESDIETYNNILKLIYACNFNLIIRTASGAISNANQAKYHNSFAYDIRVSTSRISTTVLVGPNTYNFVIGKPKKYRVIEPLHAWNTFVDICKDYGVYIDNYRITPEQGKELAKDIPAPYISMKYKMSKDDKPLENVHHIDIHSSYPSGLIDLYPEFRKPIEYIYNKRKDDNEVYKAILNYTISGCTMSKYYPWYRKWTHIAKYVREYNNKKIEYLSWLLEINGREVIGYNTDGIWYRGEVFHSLIDDEGPNIGQWSNDHINCLFRSKSTGAYEFIENGEYNAVIRGLLDLDQIEPDRKKWKWGDIYSSEIKEYEFNETTGLIEKI